MIPFVQALGYAAALVVSLAAIAVYRRDRGRQRAERFMAVIEGRES